jgi:predicted transcriptional regulator
MYKFGGVIIKEDAVKVLDEKDMEFIDALRSLKVPRNVAALIIYLANVNEATSKDIEVATNLRQPEVSIGMRVLRQNNWVEQRNVKTDGKGRPRILYRLNVPIEKIIQHYEEERNRESAIVMGSIQRLKELATI